MVRTAAPAPTSIESTTSSSSSSSTSAVYDNGLFDVDNADGKLKTGMMAQVNIVLAFTCSTLIGVAFRFLPARSASKLDPIEALARE